MLTFICNFFFHLYYKCPYTTLGSTNPAQQIEAISNHNYYPQGSNFNGT